MKKVWLVVLDDLMLGALNIEVYASEDSAKSRAEELKARISRLWGQNVYILEKEVKP